MDTFDDPSGPIEHFSWATFVVRGEKHSKTSGNKIGKGKDIRLVGEKVTKWKDREGHTLSPEMVTDVYEQNIDTLIIGSGVHGCIECPDKTIRFIQERGIPNILILKTPEACKKYNELYHDGVRVALLGHGTC